MKKSDLRTGMWFETRGGDRATVLLDTEGGHIYSGETWGPLKAFTEELKHEYRESADIVAVYQPHMNIYYLRHPYDKENSTLLYQRK